MEQPEPELRAGLLAPAEHDGHLDLVTLLEEPLDMATLGGVVVRVDLRPELDLLDDRLRLVLARFPGLERGLVLELAVVHQLAHRGSCGRRHLHQIKVGLLRQPERIANGYNPDLLAVRANEPDFGDTDTLVNSRFGADVTSLGYTPAADISGDRTPFDLPRRASCAGLPQKTPHTMHPRLSTPAHAPSAPPSIHH